jgi:hypothetical protein
MLLALAVVLVDAQPMAGPFPTAFAEVCEYVRTQHGTCERVERRRMGKLEVEMWREELPGNAHDYTIAIGSGDRWYRQQTTILGDGCGMGHCMTKTERGVRLAIRGDVAVLAMHVDVKRTCTECVPHRTERRTDELVYGCRISDGVAECGTPDR